VGNEVLVRHAGPRQLDVLVSHCSFTPLDDPLRNARHGFGLCDLSARLDAFPVAERLQLEPHRGPLAHEVQDRLAIPLHRKRAGDGDDRSAQLLGGRFVHERARLVTMASDFNDFMREVEPEARAEGPEGVLNLSVS
jgi:hypothetical protein